MNKSKESEEVIGSNSLQSIIITHLLSLILKYLDESKYWILSNEAGIHLDPGNNLAVDILIYDRSRLKASHINTEYV